MASNSGNIILSCFKLGDLVYSFSQGRRWGRDIWLSVICPDFGSSGNYTEVREGRTRLYHVQRLGSSDELEQAWIPQSELKRIDPLFVTRTVPFKIIDNTLYKADLDDCKMFAKKAIQERIEMCKIRAETFDLKTENIDLKSQLKSMQESLDEFKKFVTSQNQDKLQKEQKTLEENEQLKSEFKSLKDSFEELKNSLTSQNQDQPKNEQETESNNENAKEIMELENVEDFVEEFLKLKQCIKDLKVDNSKLSKQNENYEKVQKQNEALIKTLKEDLLKLSQENAHLKYGQGSKNGSF